MFSFGNTASKLSMRDPAKAAILGIAGFAKGRDSDFGRDYGFGADAVDDFAGEFGYDEPDFSADFGAAAVATARPTPQQAIQAWQHLRKQSMGTARRKQMLRPNDNSAVKVERYAFTISQNITLGTAAALAINGNPDTEMRPQRVTMAVPAIGYATVTNLQVANVLVTVGAGVEDAFNYSPLGQGMSLDLPTINPQNRASMAGNYTGFVPPGYVGGTVLSFSVTFRGPSSVVA